MPPRRVSKNQSLAVIVILILILLVAAYQELQSSGLPADVDRGSVTTAAPRTVVPGSHSLPAGSLPDWLEVYFTNPSPPDNVEQGIDQYVLLEIQNAARFIDVTSFDLNLPTLVNALADANKRGVMVRVVYDGTNGNLELENDLTGGKTFNAIKTLKAARVKLVDAGRSNGLMHDKMLIVDGKTLFVGSWNLSYNDTFRNNNNLLKITQPKIIANYQAKFNELFVDKKFGTQAEVKVPYPSVNVDGTLVENYFSPEDGVMAKLVAFVQGAKSSIHYMIFTFTSNDLANAMISQAKAGVDVRGVIESRSAGQGALPSLFCARLPVKIDGNKYTMHHKVIVIDRQVVITGSFNFTKSADTANDDNVIILHNPAVAALFEQEFDQVSSAGTAPLPEDVRCGK